MSENGQVIYQTAAVADATPHNIEAEQAVLGALLIDPDAFYMVDTEISPKEFYSAAHGQIYQAICEIHQDQQAIDLITVTARLREAGVTEIHGRMTEVYLADLITVVPSSFGVDAYAKIVVNAAMRRSLIQAGREIASVAANGKISLDEMVEKSQRVLLDVTERTAERGVQSARQIISGVIDTVYERINSGNHQVGLKTGFKDLDALLGGLKPEDVILLAARPGMGKSVLEGLISLYVAQHYGGVARFNLEMSSEQLMIRLLASASRLPYRNIEEGRLTSAELETFNRAVGELSGLPMFVDDTPSLSIAQLSAKARRLHMQHGLKLVTLDYVQLMAVERSYGNRNQDIGQISRGIKHLAKELHVPVLVLAQLSRGVESRAEKRPLLSDLRDSGELEQDADCVMFIYRDEYYNPDTTMRPNVAEIEVAKHRNGPTGTADLYFHGPTMTFRNLAKQTINL